MDRKSISRPASVVARLADLEAEVAALKQQMSALLRRDRLDEMAARLAAIEALPGKTTTKRR